MTKEMFTNVKSIMGDGMPMFLASDVRELLKAKDKPLEVTPVVVAVDGVAKVHHMVTLIALVDAVLDKTMEISEEDFLSFMKDLFSTLGGDGNESDTD